MEKYEIMLVINPELDKTAATKELNEILSLINNNKDFKITDLGKKELAYTINKNSKEFTHGLYLLLNFDSETPVDFNEFNRLSLLDKNVLRHLIINLTKDYGWAAINNPKKVAKSKIKQEKFLARKADYEKKKATWQKSLDESSEMSAIIDEVGTGESNE